LFGKIAPEKIPESKERIKQLKKTEEEVRIEMEEFEKKF
jgi:hypothetical protein